MKKEKIMIITGWVFPGTGGSIAVLNNLLTYFKKDEVILVGRPHVIDNTQKWDSYLPRLYQLKAILPPKGRTNKYRRFIAIPHIIGQLKQIAKEEKCTKIFSVFPDEFLMYAAYRLSKQLDLPFYTWFHNTYLDNRQGFWKKIAARWQPLFFDHATINFVMSEGLRDYYKGIYPTVNFEPLEHGFVIPKVTHTLVPKPNGKIKFMFSGSLNASCIDASMRLFRHIIANPNYELHIFTGDPRFLDIYDIKGDNVHLYGFVAWSEFLRMLPQFDIMLLPHGFTGGQSEAEYKTIFPTRTIPLLYSNRPILAHSPPNVFLTEFLRKHDCAEVVDVIDTKTIQKAIDTLIDDDNRRNQLTKNAIKTAAFFDVNRIGKKLKQLIFD